MSADSKKDLYKSLTVLVADGRSHMRALLRAMLLQLGIKTIYEAIDTASALGFISTVNLNIAILDWDLPVCDVRKIMCLVRTSDDFTKRDLPIIGISSFASSACVQEAIKLGVSDFVVRPLSPKILERRLHRIIFDSGKGLHAGSQNRTVSSQDVKVS